MYAATGGPNVKWGGRAPLALRWRRPCVGNTFIFMPDFSLGRTGAAASEGLEILDGFQQSEIVLLASHQDGTKQDRRCNNSTWSLQGQIQVDKKSDSATLLVLEIAFFQDP